MSEINCAYGLAALNNKQKYLQPYLDQIAGYDYLFDSSNSQVKIFNSQFMRTTYNILIPHCGVSRDELIFALLTSYGIEARSWWGEPLYMKQQFKSGNANNSTYPIANDLSYRTLGLPVGFHVTFEMQEYVVRSVLEILKL